jgi:hypothetical protein
MTKRKAEVLLLNSVAKKPSDANQTHFANKNVNRQGTTAFDENSIGIGVQMRQLEGSQHCASHATTSTEYESVKTDTSDRTLFDDRSKLKNLEPEFDLSQNRPKIDRGKQARTYHQNSQYFPPTTNFRAVFVNFFHLPRLH